MNNGILVKVKDVADILPSGVAKFEGEKDYIDTRSVSQNKIVDRMLIRYENKPSRANMEVSEGCVLFAKMQNTAKVILINSENANYIYSTGFFVLKPKPDKILSEYLYYWINFDGTEALKDRLAHGATQKAINNFDMGNKFRIPLPDISVQKEIVTKLENVECVLNMLETQRDKAKLLLMNLREGLFANPPKYLPVSDIINVLYRYPTFYGFKYVSDGVPVLKISNMTDNGKFDIDKTIYDYIPKELNEKYPKTIVEKGDLIVEVRGTYIGKCAIVPDFLEGANISPNTIRVSCDRETIIPEYLWHYTFTETWKNQIAKRTNYWKVGFGTIKSTDLETVKIPIFELNQQKTILDKLNRADMVYEQFSKDVRNCRKLFQSVLKRVFGSFGQ